MPNKARKFRLQIDKDRCKSCRLCIDFCPKEVLSLTVTALNAHGVPYAECVKPDNCIGCQSCVLVCPDAAIELFEIIEE